MINFFYYIEKQFYKDTKTEAIQLALNSEVYRLKSNIKKSLSLINKAIIFDDKNDTFYYSRAILQIQKNQYKKALKDIDLAINLNKNIYYYYLIKADIFYILNNPEEEKINIKKAYELMPKAELYYEYKIEKNDKNKNYYIPSFYKQRLIDIK